MRSDGRLTGLWIVRSGTSVASPLLARVQDELYVLAFTNAPRAARCSTDLGAAGQPFYVCRANLDEVVRELHLAGVRGFIVDYDPGLTSFVSAHALPADARIE
jgi:hypothetical protein